VHATRAVSRHSVPIIACVAAGAAAIIRLFGPESIGGVGDFGARIDAEAARTGLSTDEVGPKVCIQSFATRSTNLFCMERYLTIQKENWLRFLVFLLCMTMNFSRKT
jgi:hypothetical protein